MKLFSLLLKDAVASRLTSHVTLCVQVEHPQRSKKAVWHKLLSKQRKRAVVACFRMAPLYNLPR